MHVESPAARHALSAWLGRKTRKTATDVTEYNLFLGTTADATNLHDSGDATATTLNLTSLPTNEEAVYAWLYSLIA